MSLLRFGLICPAALLVLGAGCTSNSGGSGSSYPTPQPPAQSSSMQGASASASVTDLQHVPAGARIVAYGQPPLPSFTPPGAGLLYIYDNDTSSVAKVTSIGNQMDQPVNLADFPNVTNSLDPKHNYTVYFVAQRNASALPTPLPGS